MRVGDADDEGLVHVGMRHQERLDLAGRHHVVADAQDFPEPALEDDVAGVVHDAEIARPEPAVIRECLRRLLGLLPVAARDAWTAKLQLALFADAAARTGLGVRDADVEAGHRVNPGHGA